MNKKGIIMLYILIFTIISCTIAISYFYFIESGTTSFEIGNSQEDVIKSIAKSNEVETYVNLNLKSYTKDSIDNLISNAGIENPIFKDEYILWKKGDTSCFPDDWEKLKVILSENINNKFEEDISVDIFRESNGLSVKAIVPISLGYEGENYKVNYTDNIEKEYLIENFNFDAFINEVSKIQDISNSCVSDKTCWEKEINKLNGYKLLPVEDKLFKVEFTTLSLNKEITVKIAVDFEKELNVGEKELKC